MRYHFLTVLLVVGSIIYFSSCDFDNDNVNSYNRKEIAIDGFVTDEYGNPLEGASVEFENNKSQSDKDGYFKFPTTSFKDKVYVKVNKSGYFTGSKTLFLDKTNSVRLTISLLEKKFSIPLNGTNGGVINLEDKVRINFSQSSLMDLNGNTYNGNVNVAIKYLDPSENKVANTIPGNLVGLNANGEMKGLASYAMAAIELQTSSGSLLKIRSDKAVTIELAIPETLQKSAPPTIPLWYFDESTGLWKEEGQAYRNGNYYSGIVRHFSFWNCDRSLPLIRLEGKVIYTNGIPVISAGVKLTIVSSNDSRFASTNNDGLFEGPVPKDEIFNLEVFNRCREKIFEQLIGPFSSDAKLDPIILKNNNQILTITGTIYNKDNQPVPSISVEIRQTCSDFYNLITDKNGKFSLDQDLCSSIPVSLSIYNFCGGPLYNATLPITKPIVDFGKIIIQSSVIVNVSGKVVDCFDNGFPNVSVNAYIGRNQFTAVTDKSGNYLMKVLFCNSDIASISAYNTFNNVSSNILYFNNADSIIQLSDLIICNNPVTPPVSTGEFIKVQYSDGGSHVFEYSLTLENLGERNLFSNTTNPWVQIKWEGPGSLTNLTPIAEITYLTGEIQYIAKYHGSYDGTITFTNIPKVIGEYYEASFKGIHVNKLNVQTGEHLGTELSVNGSFKILKTY